MKMNGYNNKIWVTLSNRHCKVIRTYRLIAITLFLYSAITPICEGNGRIKRNLPDNGLHVGTAEVERNKDQLDLWNEEPFIKNEIKSRKKRLRRNPSPLPLAEVLGSSSLNSGSTFRIAQEQVQNSHKPIFERCDEYQPSVKEESARGRTLIVITSN